VPLVDESVVLGLGDRVARDGRIGSDARTEVVRAVAAYAETARRMGARDITLVGTEPVRRAFDAANLAQEVEEQAGVGLHVVSHDEEAMLTLLGVTKGSRVRDETLVVDIGGGSSELVIVEPDRPIRAVGIRVGSASLTQEHVRADPPTLAEVDTLREAARAAIAEAPDANPASMVAVGGTASNLLRLLPRPRSTRPHPAPDRRRARDAHRERSTEAAERHLLRPQRAGSCRRAR
jgi:exopolyphosphatase/guanosine-5'-triphosphate,3'-diphosphate pyrophosphatase